MNQFQIKVINAESNEKIQSMLFELGYVWEFNPNQIRELSSNYNYITATSSVLYRFMTDGYRYAVIPEITIQELEEMVVSHKCEAKREAEILKRRSIQDATHVNDITGFKYLLLKHTRHEWHNNSWVLTDIDFNKLKPIDTKSSLDAIAKSYEESNWIYGDEAKKLWGSGESLLVGTVGNGSVKWTDLDRSYSLDVFDGKFVFVKKPVELKTVVINSTEVPAPLNIEPVLDAEYWITSPAADCLALKSSWGGSLNEKLWLKRGLLHSTRENAMAYAEALISISGGKV